MNEVELLNWARGPGLVYATVIMCLGIALRIVEILGLGRPKEMAEVRASGNMAGLRTILRRSIPETRYWRYITAAYVFHIGLFVVIFLFVPHIQVFKGAFGFSWPGLPNFVTDVFAVLAIGAMIYTLVARFAEPSRRALARVGDHIAWAVTFLPLLTGYMAYHRLGLEYTSMLALHILSVELLMVALPFTKLTHAFTFVFARWYTGSNAGRRGVI